MPIPEHLEALLRRLTIGDDKTLDGVMRGEIEIGLDTKTAALVLVPVLVAMEADSSSYQAAFDRAHAAGVEDHEILEAVAAVAGLIGAARVNSAFPHLATLCGEVHLER